MSPEHPFYPGQLPPFRLEIQPKRIRPKQIRSNIDHYRAASRLRMSKLRTQRLQGFDYEAYRADFAKRYIPTNVPH